jgi:hypothetical protein
MIPPPTDALKSNMWAGLRAVHECTGPAWGLAASVHCAADMEALQTYAERHLPEIQCLFFDDAMYSGQQMNDLVDQFKAKYALPAYACVPFVHLHDDNSLRNIHEALVDMVVNLSKDLPIAYTYLEYERRTGANQRTLTYLQTKVPDDISFPNYLARLYNPYLMQLPFYSRDLVPLFENCTAAQPPCFKGSYLPVLQNRRFARGPTKLVDFCKEEGSAGAGSAGAGSTGAGSAGADSAGAGSAGAGSAGAGFAGAGSGGTFVGKYGKELQQKQKFLPPPYVLQYKKPQW